MSAMGTSEQIPYLYNGIQFPTDNTTLAPLLSKTFADTANAVNARTIGTFNQFQIVTGDQYYNNNNNNVDNPIQFRQAYRQLYVFGAIVAGATLSINHNIPNIVEGVHMYGNCITDVPDFRPIPYVTATGDVTFQIELKITSTQIIIINGASAPNIVSGTIILETLQN